MTQTRTANRSRTLTAIAAMALCLSVASCGTEPLRAYDLQPRYISGEPYGILRDGDDLSRVYVDTIEFDVATETFSEVALVGRVTNGGPYVLSVERVTNRPYTMLGDSVEMRDLIGGNGIGRVVGSRGLRLMVGPGMSRSAKLPRILYAR